MTHMSLHQRLEVLTKCDLFQSLPAEELSALAEHSIERTIRQGEVLFHAGDPSDGLYIVLRGAIRALRMNPDGREQTIHVEGPGGMLAEVAVFDGGPYPATTIAEEDSAVLYLARNNVRRFLLEHPAAALGALSALAKKLRMVAAMVEQLSLMDVGQRLASLLLEEAQKQTPHLANGSSFSLPLSHGQIAARLGSVREVISRGLQKLTRLGVISVQGHRITVLDVATLRAHAESTASGR
jgi:CRP/FNR family transcriptional regulator